MKVAIFAPFLYPFHFDMVNSLRKLRNIEDARLFTIGTYGNYPFENLLSSAEKLKSYNFFSQKFLSISSIARFIIFRPHIVILFGIESIPGLMLYFVSRAINAKPVVIVEENNITIEEGRIRRFLSFLKRQVVRYVYKRSEVIVAESKASVNYVLNVINIKRHKPIYVHPHGVSTERFSKYHGLETAKAKRIIVEKYSLPKEIIGKIWLSFIGEPSYCKGTDVLIDAIYTLKAILPLNSYMILFPKEESLLRDASDLRDVYLKKLAKLTYDGTVALYPAILLEDMPIFYRASDVVVIPSRLMKKTSSDRSPNVALEALASGKILVASYVGGIPDIVGNVGVLVKPNDSTALAKMLADVLVNLGKYKHLERFAVMRARRCLDIRLYAVTILKSALTMTNKGKTRGSKYEYSISC